MPIEVVCNCGRRYLIRDRYLGRRARCLQCKRQFYVCEKMLANYLWRREPELSPDELFDAGMAEVPQTTTTQPTHPNDPTPPPAREPGDPVVSPFIRPGSSLREYIYWIPLATLFLLALALGQDRGAPLNERIERTLEQAPPTVREKAERLLRDRSASMDEFLSVLPDGKLVGAHLPRDSRRHVAYGALAFGAFFSLLLMMFPRGTTHWFYLIVIAFLTGTVGMGFLLLTYQITDGILSPDFGSPTDNFTFSLVSFTLGVGMLEEACKVLPILWYFCHGGQLTWRAACLWGFASGVGFGVSEGIAYSGEMYNGIHSWEIYAVRFASCVALHAMWSGASGVLLARWQSYFRGDHSWFEKVGLILLAISIPAFLHGLYDTLLTMGMLASALLTGVVSFGWLTWLIEDLRRLEAVPPATPATEPAST